MDVNELVPLVARSILYRWAARMFFYPNDTLIQVWATGQGSRDIAAATAVLTPIPPALVAAHAEVHRGCAQVQIGELGLAEEHTYLFARSVHCPPYETSYAEERGLALGQDLSEIAGFYAAFGVQGSEQRPERPDHVSLELEFVSYLYAKEAYALEQGWTRRARLCRAARERFLREHLGSWLPKFAERLEQHARLPFYPAVAGFVRALLSTEPASLGARHEGTAHPGS